MNTPTSEIVTCYRVMTPWEPIYFGTLQGCIDYLQDYTTKTRLIQVTPYLLQIGTASVYIERDNI